MSRSHGRALIAALAATAVSAHTLAAQSVLPARDLADAVRAAITTDALERHTRAIVQHDRPSGSAGENAAIDHIVASLKAAGVPVDVYTIRAYASDPVSARVRVVGSDYSPDAITVSFSGVADGIEAPLVDVGTLRDLPDLQPGTGERLVLPPGAGRGLPDVRGRIALVDGQPRNAPVAVLAELGAVAVVFANPEERLNDLIVTSTWGTPSLRNMHRLPTTPVAEVKRSAGQELRRRLATGDVRLRVSTDVRTGWKPLRLAVARIMPAGEPDAPFVLFGGHIDAWHRGGTDEGASNAAMLELARAFHAKRDRLRRGLVVAWWPGHSNARYGGSTWFADTFFDTLRERAVAYVNVDGIGQMDARDFSANTTASLARLATDIVRERTGQSIRPTPPGRNSDQSFNGVGLPLLQINHSRTDADGGYWWWHTPDDDIDKVDFEVLRIDAGLYADALAALLAAPALPVDAVAEIEALGDAISRRQQAAGAHFDLAEAVRRQQALLGLVRAWQGRGGPATRDDAGLATLRVLRPLYRVLYSPSDPFHPDGGTEGGALPGLAPIEILNEAAPDSDLYGFALTTLVRERNRLLEALDTAIEEAKRLGAGAVEAP